jgi:hypothetical protein
MAAAAADGVGDSADGDASGRVVACAKGAHAAHSPERTATRHSTRASKAAERESGTGNTPGQVVGLPDEGAPDRGMLS